MQTIYGREDPFPPGPSTYVALGVFDGVHLGHQRILRELTRWATECGGQSVVLTFQRHPGGVLEHKPPSFITSVQHRLRLFADLGIDVCGVLTFDERLAATEPEDFVRDVLCGWAGARGVLVGHDQHFGHRGRGDAALLRRMAPETGLEVRVVGAVRAGRQIISSTVIREAIVAGDLKAASEMLGRPVAMLGTVVRGQHKGHNVGFPTANLDVHHEIQLPEGVYAASARVGGRELPAVANIGRRPTFSPVGPAYVDRVPVVEVHILDFGRDLYGSDVEVCFHRKIRDEMPFRDMASLREQIKRDAAAAHAFFAARTPPAREPRA